MIPNLHAMVCSVGIGTFTYALINGLISYSISSLYHCRPTCMTLSVSSLNSAKIVPLQFSYSYLCRPVTLSVHCTMLKLFLVAVCQKNIAHNWRYLSHVNITFDRIKIFHVNKPKLSFQSINCTV